jgi:methionyl-tRNA formyltransferase
MAGDATSGICIMQMEAGLDTGPVLLREALAIGPEETTADQHDRLSVLGARLIVQALDQIDALVAEPQPDLGVTYASKIDKAEARIDWTRPAVEVDRQIRGLSPFPGAWCDVAGERLKLLRSRVVAGAGAPGQVLHGLTIACGEGAVEVLEAQREGKKPAAAHDLLRGFTMPERLG